MQRPTPRPTQCFTPRLSHHRKIEPLEARRLLSSVVLLPGGVLRIVGEDGVDDVATVANNLATHRVDVVFNGAAVRSFPRAKVNAVEFYGRAGNDSLTVVETAGVFDINTVFYGGDGNDTFRGGSESDTARGNAGDDALYLGNGKNVAQGDEGNDTLTGGDGIDILQGNAGDDTIDAGAGTNYVSGGDGNDTILDATSTPSSLGTTTPVALAKVYVVYNGTSNPTVINPYASKGVNITMVGGAVSISNTSGISNLEFDLLGTSSAGSLNVSSTTPATFVLNNLSLTNASGAALNFTGGQINTIVSTGTNSLTDGTGSAKNGTVQSDGKLIFGGTGTLAVAGLKKHAIVSTASIDVQSSAITVSSAISDGLHSEGFTLGGGTVTVSASGADGIDAGDGAVAISNGTINITSTVADVKALKTGNNTIHITGGALNLNVSGNASKAVSAKGAITTSGGTFVINLSGAVVLTASGSGFDPSYCSGIKSDAALYLNGGTFTITATSAATGAKGFSSGTGITITNGTYNVTTAAPSGVYVNTLGVADTYSTSAFTTDASINISGGTFTLGNSGKQGKGLSADVDVNISGGTIGITNSGQAGRGINADRNITFAGGTSNIGLTGAALLTASGSGFDPSYPTGAKANGTITLSAGSVTVVGTSAATGARGLSGDAAINVTGGSFSATLAGSGTTYTNSTGVTDSYAAAALSSDAAITITGGTVTTSSSGAGGKGIKSDGTITIGSASGVPTLNITTTGARFPQSGTDYNHPKTIVATGAINIVNGNLTINSTDDGIHSDASVTISGGSTKVTASSTVAAMGEGIEAPIVNISGGVTDVTASNDAINTTYGTVSGGTNSDDGSQLNISGGILIAVGKDAIDSNGDIIITGGTTIVCGPTAAPEEGIDYNGQFYMNGGLIISAGSNSNMTLGMTTGSTQTSVFLKSSAALASSSLLHIENAAGTEMVTFRPRNNAYYFHFSSGAMAQGTQYKVYFGGTYTGGSYVGNTGTWGLYSGGTWSSTGATLKSTFTTSTTTKVNTISF